LQLGPGGGEGEGGGGGGSGTADTYLTGVEIHVNYAKLLYMAFQSIPCSSTNPQLQVPLQD